MQVATQLELIDRVERHLATGGTDLADYNLVVPAAHYVDPAQTRLEVERVFRQRPLLVGLTPDLPEPGAYFTHDAVGTALLMVRDDGGRVRAFVNACRHRGARIAEGRGVAKSFPCPFHAWNYGRDGVVKSRPNACGGFDGSDDAYAQLLELPSVERAGMIFVLLDDHGGTAAPIAAQVDELIGGVVDEIAGYDIAGMQHFGGISTTEACNWKFIVDGFCESYHIRALHKDTISPYYLCTAALTDRFGDVVRMIGVRNGVEKELAKPREARRFLRYGTTQYLVQPNVVLTHQVDHIQLWRIYPVDGQPDRCEVHFALYWPQPLDDEARRKCQFNLDVIWKVTNEEDFTQSRTIHRNLASGSVPDVLFGRNEPALIHFHENLARTLGSTALRRAAPR